MQMTFEEYSRRVLGEGTTIDLSINEEKPQELAVMLAVESTPYIALLKRIKNLLVKYDNEQELEEEAENILPIYLKIIGKPVLNIGNIDLTISNVNKINKIFSKFNPRFYYVENGVVTNEITYLDLVNTIKLTGGKNINEYI